MLKGIGTKPWVSHLCMLALLLIDASVILLGLAISAICTENPRDEVAHCIAFALSLVALPAFICLVAGAILYLMHRRQAAFLISAFPVLIWLVFRSLYP